MLEGGLVHYYYGAHANLAAWTPNALARIGVKDCGIIMVEANALFPEGMPPRELRSRRAALHAIDPVGWLRLTHLADALSSQTEVLEERLLRYTHRHVGMIAVDAGILAGEMLGGSEGGLARAPFVLAT